MTVNGNAIAAEINQTERDLKKYQKALKKTKEGTEEWVKANEKVSKAEEQIKKLRSQLKLEHMTREQVRKEVKRLEREQSKLNDTTEEYAVATKKLVAAKKRLKHLKDEANGVTQEKKKMGFSLDGLMGKFGKFGTVAIAAITLVVAQVVALAKEVDATSRKFIKMRGEIGRLTGTSGKELDGITASVSALATKFDKEYNEVLRASNVLVKTYGLSNQEALDLVEKGFLKGADANADFLDKILEYPVHFKKAGYSAEEFIKIATTEATSGVFSDKLVDSVKEMNLRLSELTKTQQDALTGAFGEKFTKKLSKQINEGSINVKQALGLIQAEAKKTGLSMTQLQTLTADIGGGPVEDVGGLGEAFKLLNKAQQDSLDTLDDYGKAQKQQLDLQKELDGINNEIAKNYAGTAKSMDNMRMKIQILVKKGVLWLMKKWNAFTSIAAKKLAPVRKAIGKVIAYFGTWKKEANLVRELLIEMFRKITAPIRRVVEVITRIAKGFVDLYKRSEKFRRVIKGIGAAIRAGFQVFVQVKTLAMGVVNDIFDAVTKLITLDFSGLRDSLVNAVKGAWKRIKGIGTSIKHGIQDIFNTEASQERKREEARKERDAAAKKAARERWEREKEALKRKVELDKRAAKEAAEREQQRLAKEKQRQAAQLQAAKEHWAKMQKFREAAAKAELAALRRLEDLKIALMDDDSERAIARLEVQFSREKKAIDKQMREGMLTRKTGNKLIAALEEQKNKQIQKINQDTLAEMDKWDAEERAERQAEFEEELGDIDAHEKAKALAIRQKFLEQTSDINALRRQVMKGDFTTQMEAEKEQAEASYQLKKQQHERRIELLKEFYGEDSEQVQEARILYLELQKEHNEAVIEEEKRKRDLICEMELTGLDAAQDFLSARIGMIEEETAQQEAGLKNKERALKKKIKMLERDKEGNADLIEEAKAELETMEADHQEKLNDIKAKQAKKTKKWALADLAINLGREISNIWMNASKLPVPFNIIVGTAQTGLALLRGNTQRRKIERQATQFATGGMLRDAGGVLAGSSHRQGGLAVIDNRTGQQVAEFEGREGVIFSKRTIENNPHLWQPLLHTSMYRGGAPIFPDMPAQRKFENGGALGANLPGSRTPSAGEGNATTGNVAQAQSLDFAKMLVVLESINAKLDSMPGNIRAYLVADNDALEILEDGLTERQSIRNQNSF